MASQIKNPYKSVVPNFFRFYGNKYKTSDIQQRFSIKENKLGNLNPHIHLSDAKRKKKCILGMWNCFHLNYAIIYTLCNK